MFQPSQLLASSCVALGGAIGSVLRYQTGRGFAQWLGPQATAAFPWPTLAVNIVGSLAMGLLVGVLARGEAGGEGLRLLLGVGLLGGFTTFSAFSMEMVLLAQRGAMALAALYAGVSVAGGIAAMLIGLALARVAA